MLCWVQFSGLIQSILVLSLGLSRPVAVKAFLKLTNNKEKINLKMQQSFIYVKKSGIFA